MVVDPGFWFGHFFNANAAPLDLVVDASNMQIKAELLGGNTTTLWQTIDAQLASM